MAPNKRYESGGRAPGASTRPIIDPLCAIRDDGRRFRLSRRMMSRIRPHLPIRSFDKRTVMGLIVSNDRILGQSAHGFSCIIRGNHARRQLENGVTTPRAQSKGTAARVQVGGSARNCNHYLLRVNRPRLGCR